MEKQQLINRLVNRKLASGVANRTCMGCLASGGVTNRFCTFCYHAVQQTGQPAAKK